MREREAAREIEIYRVRSMQCRKREIYIEVEGGREKKHNLCGIL